MFYTTRFTDTEAKERSVELNRDNMVAGFIVQGIEDAGDEVLPFDRDDIDDLVGTFFADHPDATWEMISDFCSSAVLDYIENKTDIEEG